MGGRGSGRKPSPEHAALLKRLGKAITEDPPKALKEDTARKAAAKAREQKGGKK